MREWILQNTNVTDEQYDSLINPNTVNINGEKRNNKSLTPNNPSRQPMLNIDLYTQQKPNLKRKLKYKIISKKDSSKKDYYIYKKIKFYILAQIITEMEDILYSLERKGKCYNLSIKICAKYPETNIITALCIDPYYKEPTPFIHTVTLYKAKDGKEYIFDTTFNIAIEKEYYLKLLKTKIISNITREKLIEDIETIAEANLGEEIATVEYLCFPEQVMTAVKKCAKPKI